MSETAPPDPTLAILGRKRGRRPSVPERCDRLSVWIPERQIDQLHQLAHDHRTSVSAMMRKIVIIGLKRL